MLAHLVITHSLGTPDNSRQAQVINSCMPSAGVEALGDSACWRSTPTSSRCRRRRNCHGAGCCEPQRGGTFQGASLPAALLAMGPLGGPAGHGISARQQHQCVACGAAKWRGMRQRRRGEWGAASCWAGSPLTAGEIAGVGVCSEHMF